MQTKNKTKTNRKPPNSKLTRKQTFDDLVSLFARLRAPGGCPWDRAQDHRTLKPYIIEEAYEVVEAVEERNSKKLQEELGDLLGQVIFHAQIAKEDGKFGIEEVIAGQLEKMTRRHPHIFAKTKVKDAAEVLLNWEEIKYREKKKERPSALDGVPKHLPALLKAHRIQDKAARLGFDWEHIDGAFAKLEEELQEFSKAYAGGRKKEITDELGDIFFTLVNLSRFLNVDPEGALRGTIDKFTSRFQHIEKSLKKSKKSFKEVSLGEMEALWQQSKKRNLRKKPRTK
ncbi:MAG: nucleoside triphosphate pyrophosphohydrolase [Candidatus Edwardsbacteria bacterium]|nr:nucleoside triphosphate pyrophosphohydrolase [Candidatus Edwardsbacteria bacterium]MBU2594458.1 nucleoside triphosphate pyrophosphohydrolase [Candidatus Edwardsbacteria bacterium]